MKAIKSLHNGKAPGPDNIPPEALKADIDTTVEMMHVLFGKVWDNEEIPSDWKESHIVKIPKKGDLSNCNNYRGISLLSIPGKVFNRVILERIRDATDPQLRDQQAGFRRNRSCSDQIATLRIIVEQSLEWKSPLYINFIDYEKAFDSLDRATLWKLLCKPSPPPEPGGQGREDDESTSKKKKLKIEKRYGKTGEGVVLSDPKIIISNWK